MCEDRVGPQTARREPDKNETKEAEKPETGKKPDGEIGYQNKDIASKLFAERLKGKSFSVYGMEMGEVKEILPTNLPAIKVNELRLDNLLGLEDGTLAVVDYESDYKKESKVKYLNYLAGIVNRYESEKTDCPNLRMIVIYTGDVKREEVSKSYNVGAVRLVIEPAFLSEVDGDEIYKRLKRKVEKGEDLSGQEEMELVIFPLTYRRKEEKRKRIDEAIDLVMGIQNREQQIFVLAGLMTFTDKIMDEETADRIKRRIRMTKIAMLFEKEKEEAVMAERRKREEAQKEKKKALEDKEKTEKLLKLVLKMLEDSGLSVAKMAENSDLDVGEVTKVLQGLS